MQVIFLIWGLSPVKKEARTDAKKKKKAEMVCVDLSSFLSLWMKQDWNRSVTPKDLGLFGLKLEDIFILFMI